MICRGARERYVVDEEEWGMVWKDRRRTGGEASGSNRRICPSCLSVNTTIVPHE